MGFLIVKTGDSTCRPRDSKEGYLYHTELGFTKQFSEISKRLETHFVKTIGSFKVATIGLLIHL